MKANKINLTAKKIFASLLGFFGIGTLTACYGVDRKIDPAYDGNVAVGCVKYNGKAVRNILVYAADNPENQCVTDEYGYYELHLSDSLSELGTQKIFFEDRDGKENGGSFEKDSAVMNFLTSNTVILDVELKPTQEL